ncbi:MAG: acyloxyacyl hydrolase [Candidatus Dormibacteria bacterium]
MNKMVTWLNTKIVPFLKRVSPLGNSLPAQIVLYAMVLLFFVGLVTRCGMAKADEVNTKTYQVDIMTGSTVVRGPTGVLSMNLRFPKLVANYADLSVGFALIGSSNYPCGTCYNNNQAILHAQVVAPLKWGFELGIGVAKIQHSDAYNSGAINFSLGMQHTIWKRLMPNLFWRYQHFSNAGTFSPNRGRDMVLVGWRIK